ncbi:MAG TPA: hypothetical protein VK206_02435 [Anaerolineales bacterium]|nr:hypothetical protein [Anaerolineales bacterium]HLO31842.1 hypothetical protein [Anaerolineales bacterium]
MNNQRNTSILPSTTSYLLQQMLLISNRSMVIDRRIVKRLSLVKSISARTGVVIPSLGIAPLFEEVKLITQTRPNWAFYNVQHDPLWQRGHFPIPRKHLHRLNQLYRNGIEFDALYIAHELPPEFDSETDHLELSLIEPEPPQKSIRLAQGFGVVSDGIVATYGAVIRKPVRGLAAISKIGAKILLDPILMGALVPPGVNPEEGVQAAWFLLAAWRW